MAGDQGEFFDDHNASKDTSHLRRLAKRAVLLDEDIEKVEKNLTSMKAELLELRREKIPMAMAELGFNEIKLDDGSKVAVSSFVHGSIPKDDPIKRAQAIALLEEHGGADLIKNELVVTFGRKDHNRAVALKEELAAAGYDTSITSSVHHATLSAWCREKVKHGEQLDFEKLGVFVGSDTKITLPGQIE